MTTEKEQRMLLGQRCRFALEACLNRVEDRELHVLLEGTDEETLRLLLFREGFFDPAVRQRFRQLMSGENS